MFFVVPLNNQIDVQQFVSLSMSIIKTILVFITLFFSVSSKCFSQADTAKQPLSNIPTKYLRDVNKKIDKYISNTSSKTEKTLIKLSKWENKIHNLLFKVDPAMSERLFGSGKMTFSNMLQKIKAGQSVIDNYSAEYDGYIDRVETGINYIDTKKEELNSKAIKPLATAKDKLKILDNESAKNEAVAKLIQERKKQLIEASLKLLGKNKYLIKINKEAYYFKETIKGYKEIFKDTKKTEKLALDIINKIPAFKKFFAENSQLSSIFGISSMTNSTASVPIVNGLPSRASLQTFFQQNIPSVSDPSVKLSQQLQLPDFKSKLDKIKSGGNMDNSGLPDFKPNSQKTKSFTKRLEKGIEVQFGKSINFIPATCNLAVTLGYKLNEKCTAGIGAAYILGLGKGWDKIRFSNEGIGLRTYAKMKLYKSIDIQGGGEWYYSYSFKSFRELKYDKRWQQSALLGISKNIAAGKKLKSEIKILFDFLYTKHNPVTQPFIFRFGYHL